jgi:hypothetical protein
MEAKLYRKEYPAITNEKNRYQAEEPWLTLLAMFVERKVCS